MATVVQRVVTGASLAVGAGALLWGNSLAAPGVVPIIASTVLFAACVWELRQMPRICSPAAVRGIVLSGLVCLSLAFVWGVGDEPLRPAPEFALGYLYAAAWICAWFVGRTPADPGTSLISSPRLSVWLAPPFAALVLFAAAHGTDGGGGGSTRALVALVLLSKIGDIFGYFVGRKIGRIKPFKVSPNKSLEGCTASLVAGILAGAWAAWGGLLPGTGIANGALLGGLLNLAAQAGDFLESAVKRRAEVKDSSGIAGASGGVLDVVDSLLLTIPAAFLLWPFRVGN